ncbi:hypothetical protein AMK16_22560 [Streptomyces sp. CB00455]|nr:hypothetical protein AMK16_22560 [Streptomyces sp. CB00455]
MHSRDDRPDPDREPGLTTQDIAHPGAGAGAAGERGAAVFPGEATATDDADRAGARDDADRADTRDAYGEGFPAGEDVVKGDAGAGRHDLAGGNGAVQGNDTAAGRGGAGHDADEPLLGSGETEDLRTKWSEIQGRFVDDPQDAVRSADSLVAEVMQTLAATFSSHKQGLEGQWDRGEQVATEDLRLALQHYRSFFNRLLNT